jgi:hypothetical protein
MALDRESESLPISATDPCDQGRFLSARTLPAAFRR